MVFVVTIVKHFVTLFLKGAIYIYIYKSYIYYVYMHDGQNLNAWVCALQMYF